MQEYRVDPINIAESYGIDIIKEDNYEYSSSIENINSKYILKYNSTLNEHSKRFSITHSLAHFLLKHFKYRNKFYDKKFLYNNEDILESEANILALKILIPENIVKYLLYIKRIQNIEELSEIFDVSTASIHLRLKELKII